MKHDGSDILAPDDRFPVPFLRKLRASIEVSSKQRGPVYSWHSSSRRSRKLYERRQTSLESIDHTRQDNLLISNYSDPVDAHSTLPHKMRLIKPLLLVVSPLSSLVAATPIHPDDVQGRDLFKVSPGLDKRTLFNVEHIESAERRKFLQDAQKEAVDIAVVALKNFDNPKYRGYLTAWFGRDPKGHPGEVDDDVRGVLTNFVGDNANGEGSVVLSGVTVWQDDYLPVRPKWCDKIDKEGRSATAYYSPTRKGGLGPSMHYCDKFFDRKNKADFLANNCASIANHIDTATTTRQYRGANVLHEFMHYGKVSEGQ